MKLRSRRRAGVVVGPLLLVLVEFADEAGGVELDQELAQLVELCRSELLFQFGLDLGDDLADGSRRGVSSRGEADALEALVFRVVVAGEVPELLHLSEQVVHRLSGHQGFGGELGRAAVLRSGVAQNREMGRHQVRETGVVEASEDSCDDGVERNAQQRADQRGPEWIFRFGGQVT